MDTRLIRCALVVLLCIGMTGCATIQQEFVDINKALHKEDGTLDWERIARGLEAAGKKLPHKSVVYPPTTCRKNSHGQKQCSPFYQLDD